MNYVTSSDSGLGKLHNYAYKDACASVFYLLFHRGLAIVYLVALFPLFFQIKTLIGQNGLLPATSLLNTSIATNGLLKTVLQFPSLFILVQHDNSLYFLILLGCIGAILLWFRQTAFLGAILAWLSFLSLTTIGGDFLIIIIDLFLSEVGFLAIFSTYFLTYKNYIPNVVDVAFRILNFRLWFCMGINKFYLPQEVWTNFTFFDYFFQAQPMPTPMAKIFHHTPWLLKHIAEILLFVGEVIVPFFLFGGKTFRLLAFFTFFIISCLIQLNGNYGYFNLLSIVTSLTILKVGDFHNYSSVSAKFPGKSIAKRSPFTLILSFQILMQIGYCFYVFNPTPYSLQNQFNYFFTTKKFENKVLDVVVEPIRWVGYWRICNPYGVFKGIPQFHGEIRFSGSTDSLQWKDYEFKYLPSSNTDYLGFYAPYYPRLDHLFFYETLSEGAYQHNPLNTVASTKQPWTCIFIKKLLENDSGITALLKKNPFVDGQSPKYIRVEAYRLQFDQSQNKNWIGEKVGVSKNFTIKNNPCNLPILSYDEAMALVFKKR